MIYLSVLPVREHAKRNYCKKKLSRKILSPGRINVVKNAMNCINYYDYILVILAIPQDQGKEPSQEPEQNHRNPFSAELDELAQGIVIAVKLF